mgnify:CR=1 FL=1
MNYRIKKEEISLELPSNSLIAVLVGHHSINLVKLEKLIDVSINLFGNQFNISGNPENINKAKLIISNVYNKLSLEKLDISEFNFSNFETELRMINGMSFNAKSNQKTYQNEDLKFETWKKTIIPKSLGQKKYFEALNNFELVFGLGPAGTGKSYLAVAKGIHMLKKGLVEKIILTRPAVEAGENLGFLPGDIKNKLDPYIQPLYDALYDMIPTEKLHSYLERGIIQISPLAFMRGRTLNNAFVILDEAQNATHSQMKMFLTRMGPEAKFIITGDPGQVDLPKKIKSGLNEALDIFKKTSGIKILRLDEKDVIRHKLVKKIIAAYN